VLDTAGIPLRFSSGSIISRVCKSAAGNQYGIGFGGHFADSGAKLDELVLRDAVYAFDGFDSQAFPYQHFETGFLQEDQHGCP
jgi:hypothetical protein